MGDDTRVATLVIEKTWGREGNTTVTVTTAGCTGDLDDTGTGNVIAGRIIKESVK